MNQPALVVQVALAWWLFGNFDFDHFFQLSLGQRVHFGPLCVGHDEATRAEPEVRGDGTRCGRQGDLDRYTEAKVV